MESASLHRTRLDRSLSRRLRAQGFPSPTFAIGFDTYAAGMQQGPSDCHVVFRREMRKPPSRAESALQGAEVWWTPRGWTYRHILDASVEFSARRAEHERPRPLNSKAHSFSSRVRLFSVAIALSNSRVAMTSSSN